MHTSNLFILISLFLLNSCSSSSSASTSTNTSVISDSFYTSSSTTDICGSDDNTCSASDFETTEYNNQRGLDIINAADAYAYLENNSLDWGGDDIKIAIVDI